MAEPDGRQALEAAIAEIDRQIEDRQRAKQVLVGLLGGTIPTTSPLPNSSSPIPPAPAAGDPLSLVREQEFHGMSKAEAARVFLKRVGAQKTGTILAALVKGGLTQESKFPESALYTSLARHSAFVSLKKNWWDLAERRPDLVEEQREQKRRLTRKSKTHKKRRLPKKSVVEEQPDVPAGAD